MTASDDISSCISDLTDSVLLNSNELSILDRESSDQTSFGEPKQQHDESENEDPRISVSSEFPQSLIDFRTPNLPSRSRVPEPVEIISSKNAFQPAAMRLLMEGHSMKPREKKRLEHLVGLGYGEAPQPRAFYQLGDGRSKRLPLPRLGTSTEDECKTIKEVIDHDLKSSGLKFYVKSDDNFEFQIDWMVVWRINNGKTMVRKYIEALDDKAKKLLTSRAKEFVSAIREST